MTVDSTRLRTERDGRVLRIVLSAPERANAVDTAFAAAFEEAAGQVDSSVGCVAIVAEGVNFCVGGDVKEFAAAPDRRVLVHEIAGTMHRATRALHDAGPPLVVGVQGWAAGIGLSIALAADILVVEESAKFRTAYTGIGLTPDGGMSWLLPRSIGRARALDMLLTNRAMDAAEALGAGLASRAVPDGTVHASVAEVAGTLAAGPTTAYGRIRALVDDGGFRPLAEHLDVEEESIADQSAGPEGTEGINAFVERRSPKFS